jgi:hypothetical protein
MGVSTAGDCASCEVRVMVTNGMLATASSKRSGIAADADGRFRSDALDESLMPHCLDITEPEKKGQSEWGIGRAF